MWAKGAGAGAGAHRLQVRIGFRARARVDEIQIGAASGVASQVSRDDGGKTPVALQVLAGAKESGGGPLVCCTRTQASNRASLEAGAFLS